MKFLKEVLTFSSILLILFSFQVAQAGTVTKGVDFPENLEINKVGSQIIKFSNVCFPDGYDTDRCYDALDTLHLLSNERVSIIGSCEQYATCKDGSWGTKLKAKVIIVE